ncbi:MAG: hypothetical protein LIO77_03695 [Rikenellaceae bacterium]|nr:hypothetical protein [Rikenellaceae bacterium]
MAEFKMGIIREIAENRNNTIDWQITYFDPEGNIRSISCAAHSDDLKLESGSGYYYATEIISEVDTIRYAKGEDISAYTKSVIKEDEMGFLFSDFPHILNDSIILRVRTQAYMSEEGLVENNFKIGQWKYYNDKGETIRTANYHLKDRIDVRFPYYYFNICEDSGCPINLNGR